MKPLLEVQALVPPDKEDMVAEGYIDGECLFIVSQENGFDHLEVEVLAKTGQEWNVKYDIIIELLQKCKNRLWELRRCTD